ncbi:MAG: hypothetical protein A4E72_00938 [Syntrophus sp. PtaU1.Bin208]|nr:MAG: hypothetical protein A4E72_00938 [Syntrophus sp. PtaU1.Bin208]
MFGTGKKYFATRASAKPGRSGTRICGRNNVLVSVVLASCFFLALTFVPFCMNRASAGNPDSAGAIKAFREAAKVLFHPRCVNCHPSGDAPMIKDNQEPHKFNVKRGPEGKGIGAMKCTRCHGDANQVAGIPGVPNWHMPPENMPMVFQDRTPGELCRQLKDPKQNGGRSGEEIINHIDKDPLVLWAWNPGKERKIPKMTHGEFSVKMREWVEKGADCPE